MLQNAKVGTRLALGFGIVIALILTVAIVGAARMWVLHDEVERFANDRVPKIEKVGQWEVVLLNTARHMRSVFLLPED